MPRFVIQKHASRTPHYDFRLERDGVFKSWAVPKGLTEEQGVRRLAVQVADHSIDFGDFEGEIPMGQHGAGTIEIWDAGTYAPLEWTEERIEVTLEGSRIAGRYVMIRFRRKGEREWLLWREEG